jgi:hypothetical protein
MIKDVCFNLYFSVDWPVIVFLLRALAEWSQGFVCRGSIRVRDCRHFSKQPVARDANEPDLTASHWITELS